MKFIATLALGMLIGWGLCNMTKVSAAATKVQKVTSAVGSAAEKAVKEDSKP